MFRFYCDDIRYYVENACSTHPHNTYTTFSRDHFLFFDRFWCFCLFFNILRKQFLLIYIKKQIGFSAHYILIISAIIISLWPLTPIATFSIIDYCNILFTS